MSLNISLSGIKAAQIGMDVTSHNIANVNTPNFHRQLVELKEVNYNSGSPHIPSGAGVAVAKIHSAANLLLNQSYPKSLSDSSEYNTLSNLAKSLDSLLTNPATNLSQAMQNTFNAFQDVANTPTSLPIRQNAINTAQIFAEHSASLMRTLNTMKNELVNNSQSYADTINSLVSNIAEVSNQINISDEHINSNLIALKDSLTLELSQLTGIEISNNGKTISTTSGKLLLSDGKAKEINANDIPNITGGSIGGTNKFISSMLNPALEKLPDVVTNIVDEINTQAMQGYDLDGNSGEPIFNNPDSTLSNFTIAITNPRKFGASTIPNGSGDGTNAQKMSDLRNKVYDGQSFQSQYGSILSYISGSVNKYKDMSEMYTGISESLYSQIKSDSGVNLDEEAVNLLKYQRMYQANAEAIKIQNEVFGTLINIMA